MNCIAIIIYYDVFFSITKVKQGSCKTHRARRSRSSSRVQCSQPAANYYYTILAKRGTLERSLALARAISVYVFVPVRPERERGYGTRHRLATPTLVGGATESRRSQPVENPAGMKGVVVFHYHEIFYSHVDKPLETFVKERWKSLEVQAGASVS